MNTKVIYTEKKIVKGNNWKRVNYAVSKGSILSAGLATEGVTGQFHINQLYVTQDNKVVCELLNGSSMKVEFWISMVVLVEDAGMDDIKAMLVSESQ